MTIKFKIRYAIERAYVLGATRLAAKAPRWLRYWLTLDAIAKATTGKYSATVVPELRAIDVLDRI
jgi:hypothetical protein